MKRWLVLANLLLVFLLLGSRIDRRRVGGSRDLIDRSWIRVTMYGGPWFSLGLHLHLGLRHWHLDLHVLWFLISLGRPYRGGRA